jgi:hypothetical protein
MAIVRDTTSTLKDHSYPVKQLWKLRLSHISGLVCNCKLTFEKGDLPSHLASLPSK